ncbi:MAG: hypothetical protein H6509_06530 [Bryobacterales bacterium]|nr:hypothetical protein [Acidobacteriota bacterium]MCB9384251.1 hypothetical protein [Bryobacterales bacterium]
MRFLSSAVGALLALAPLTPASAQRYSGTPSEPLTLTLETAPDARGVVQRTTVAIRADGSRAEATEFVKPGEAPGLERASRHVWDLSTGQSVGVYPAQRTKITLALDELGRGRPAPTPSCADAAGPMRLVEQSTETILGYTVVKVSDAARVEEWRAPELGCLPLRRRLRSGSRELREQAVAIELGQPDAALYAIPADYQEQADALRAERATVFSWRRER